MEVKSESEVAQSCPTLSDPTGCSLPDSSIHGIFQARVLEWGATVFLALADIYGNVSFVIVASHQTAPSSEVPAPIVEAGEVVAIMIE